MGATVLGAVSSPVLISGHNIYSFEVEGDVYAGDVVAMSTADWTVHAASRGTGGGIVGVALGTVTNGEHVAVAGPGCIVRVAEGDGAATIDAGHFVMSSVRPGGVVAATSGLNLGGVVGMVLDDLPVNGQCRLLVCPGPIGD